MKKLILIFLLIINYSFAQNYDPNKLLCIKYVYKIVPAKGNKPLFEPNKKKNLFVAIINAIRHNGLIAYKPAQFGREFEQYISEKEIYNQLNLAPYDKKGYFNPKKINPKKINAYVILEAWFYTKDNKLLDIRPVGLAPAFYSDTVKTYFWIYYSDIQKFIKNIKIKSPKCKNCSLADYLFNSYYSGKIIAQFFVNWKTTKIPYLAQEKIKIRKPVFFTEINQDQIKFAKLSYLIIPKNENNSFIFPPVKFIGYKDLITTLLQSTYDYNINFFLTNINNLGSGYEFNQRIDYENLKIFLNKNLQPNYFENISGLLAIYLDVYDFDDKKIVSVPIGFAPYVLKNNQFFEYLPFVYYPEIAHILANTFIAKDTCTKDISFDKVFVDKLFDYQPLQNTKLVSNPVFFDSLYVDLKYYLRLLPPQKPLKINFSFTPNLHYPDVENYYRAEIIYNKISKKQNPELFKPFYPQRGFYNFTDLIINQIEYFGNIAFQNENFSHFITEVEINKKIKKLSADKLPLANVVSIITKEIWFYDKYGNIIQKRIIGLAPVIRYFEKKDVDKKYPKYEKLFWIKFSDYLEVFQNYNITKLQPIRDVSYAEYFIRNKYKAELLRKKEISKQLANELLKL